MTKPSRNLWDKGDKFYCKECEELLFELQKNFNKGDSLGDFALVPGIGQGFRFLDPTNCKKCGYNWWGDFQSGRDFRRGGWLL